jgi:ParB family protein of integrating conjugative element (PFGI_1 class)
MSGADSSGAPGSVPLGSDRAGEPPGRLPGIEERRRLVAQSLRVGNPTPGLTALPPQADPRVECQIELELDQIQPYADNPRRQPNPRHTEIRESIRVSGIRNPLTVTRRPGEALFTVEAGGNTRLAALRELWEETGHESFRRLKVIFRPWRSELHVLSGHLIENEQRGEICFWDRARGLNRLRHQLQAERGVVLSLRQLQQEFVELGLTVNITTLAHAIFAIERLASLAEVWPGMTGLDIKLIQPRINALRRQALERHRLDDEAFFAKIIEPVLASLSARPGEVVNLRAEALCAAFERALAGWGDAAEQGLPVAAYPTASDHGSRLYAAVQALADSVGLREALTPAPAQPLGYALAPGATPVNPAQTRLCSLLEWLADADPAALRRLDEVLRLTRAARREASVSTHAGERR